MFDQIQLTWVRALQDFFQYPGSNIVFKLISLADSFWFGAILVGAVFLFGKRKVAFQLASVLLVSMMLNKLLKLFFCFPRPCQLDPLVGMPCPSSFGFPSGAAQFGMIIAGIAFLESRNCLLRVAGVAFVLLLSLSRIYLGVHFPGDILAGWCVGGAFLVMYRRIFLKTSFDS